MHASNFQVGNNLRFLILLKAPQSCYFRQTPAWQCLNLLIYLCRIFLVLILLISNHMVQYRKSNWNFCL
jgi:hypothetical protein